jgi:hypothetical protein
MRYLLLPLLLLAGCVGPYDGYYGYGPAYGPGPYPAYASAYPGDYYGDRGTYGSENCGTPEQWKACPRRWR